jgi:hypothetical protein
MQLNSLFEIIESFDSQIDSFTAKIASIAKDDPRVRLLMTMPGAPRKRNRTISDKGAGVPQHMLGESYRHAGRQRVSEARAEMRIRALPHRDPRPLACLQQSWLRKEPLSEASEVMTLR